MGTRLDRLMGQQPAPQQPHWQKQRQSDTTARLDALMGPQPPSHPPPPSLLEKHQEHTPADWPNNAQPIVPDTDMGARLDALMGQQLAPQQPQWQKQRQMHTPAGLDAWGTAVRLDALLGQQRKPQRGEMSPAKTPKKPENKSSHWPKQRENDAPAALPSDAQDMGARLDALMGQKQAQQKPPRSQKKQQQQQWNQGKKSGQYKQHW